MIYIGEDTPVLRKGDNVIVSINSIQKEHPFVIKNIDGFPFTSINFEDYSRNFIHPSHYKPEPEQKPESIYQVGDTVYHYAYGCGDIYSISPSKEEPYPISVQFDEEMVGFRLDGKLSVIDKKPSLSFVPYDLVNGGFSQERPKPELKVGDWGYFWDEEDICVVLSKINDIKFSADFKYRAGTGGYYKHFSHETPTHIKEKIK